MARAKVNEAPSIAPALAKVRRAREHLVALEEAARAYVQDKESFEHSVVQDGHVASVRIRLAKPPPDDLSLICGDAVHNLRTALDYLVWQLGIADSGEVSDKSEFPFVADPGEEDHDWKSVAGRALALLNDAHVDQIRRLQPFADHRDDNINTKLAMLDALDNRDKHRLLLVVTAAVTNAEVAATGRFRRFGITPITDGPVEVGYEPKGGPGGEIALRTLTSLGIAFGTSGGPTMKVLHDLADLVSGVIWSYASDLRPSADV